MVQRNVPLIHDILHQYESTGQLHDYNGCTVTVNDIQPNNLADMLNLCEAYMSQQQYSPAIDILTRAYAIDRTITAVIDLLALCYIENSDTDDETAEANNNNAVELLQQSIKLQPDDNLIKYCYLAQCNDEPRTAVQLYNAAIQLYNKQIELLTQQQSSTNNTAIPSNESHDDTSENTASALHALQQQLIKCYIAVVELYMTDLCDDTEAEQICDMSLQHALQIDNTSVDVLYALGNLRFIQQLYDESKRFALQAYDRVVHLWSEQRTNDAVLSNISPQDEDDCTVDEVTYELRVNIVKLLIEHSEHRRALTLLETQLLNESDAYIEVLHLTAVCYAALHNYRHALSYVEQCEKQLKKMAVNKRPGEIVRALKQFKHHCSQSIDAGEQVDSSSDSDDETDDHPMTDDVTTNR